MDVYLHLQYESIYFLLHMRFLSLSKRYQASFECTSVILNVRQCTSVIFQFTPASIYEYSFIVNVMLTSNLRFCLQSGMRNRYISVKFKQGESREGSTKQGFQNVYQQKLCNTYVHKMYCTYRDERIELDYRGLYTCIPSCINKY